MTEIILFDTLTLQIKTDDMDYLDIMIQEFTRAVPGFQFMPQYKSGVWNGRVCMIDKFRGSFPYGILMDYIRAHRKLFPKEKLIIHQDVKELFKGTSFEIKYDLKLKPRPYQKECIELALKNSKGIIRVATAGGKSLIVAYIIKNLFDSNIIKKCIIIVPTTSLVAQFFQDLISYGFSSDMIGMVFAEKKQWNKPITISTWQSLSRNHKKIVMYDCVIVDEVHQAQALEIKKILQHTKNAKYRLGFTGTLHSDDLNNWNTKSFLGPIIKEFSTSNLSEQGYISKAVIHMMNIEYRDKWSGDYHELRDSIFQNEFRLKLIKTLVDDLNHNVLILVDKVEKEGEFLKDYLKDVNKEVVFLSGKDKVDVREMWRKACMKRKDIALIATYGIFQMGVNIPNLQNIILASPFKAKIRILQSIGRALRKHANKLEGAQIFDIHDHIKFFEKYGDIRLRHYDSEGFEIHEHVYHEGTIISFDLPEDLFEV